MNSRRRFLGQLLMATPAMAATIALTRSGFVQAEELPLIESATDLRSDQSLIESIANRFWARRGPATLTQNNVLFYQCEMVRGESQLDVAIDKLVEITKDVTEFGIPYGEEYKLWKDEIHARHFNVHLTKLPTIADGGEPFYFVSVGALDIVSDTYADNRPSRYQHQVNLGAG